MAGGIMNIVISGIGKFGKELIEHLAKENHNIVKKLKRQLRKMQ